MLDRLATRACDPIVDRCFFGPPELKAEVRDLIRPLDPASSRLAWDELICRNRHLHPMRLPGNHWSRIVRSSGPDWVEVWNHWNAGATLAPDPVAVFFLSELPWPDDAPALFVAHRDDATLTTWGTFVAAWPHFLRCSDEGPLVVSWERPEFLGFGPSGGLSSGVRPAPPARPSGDE